MSTLIVHCDEYFRKVQDFAIRTHQEEAFARALFNLVAWLPQGYTLHLYGDFAPYSFYWTQNDATGSRVMNGGLIYHGSHDCGGDGSGPTFSVNLIPASGWMVHT